MSNPTCKSCRGQCCTFAPMSMREFKSIRKKYGIPDGSILIHVERPRTVMVVRDRSTGTCSYLTDEGRCSVYEDRPWICRVYGESDAYPCAVTRPFVEMRREAALAAIRGPRFLAAPGEQSDTLPQTLRPDP